MAPTSLSRKHRTFSAPAYKRIEDDLRARIRGWAWRAGTRIPGRRELARSYNVELNTLQRAIANLIEDGTLRAESGRGTFVSGDDLAALLDSPGGDQAGSVWTGDVPPSASRVFGIVGEFDERENSSSYANTWNDTLIVNVEQVLNAGKSTIRYARLMLGNACVRTLLEAVVHLRQDGVQAVVVAGIYVENLQQTIWEVSSAYPDLPIIYIGCGPIIHPVRHIYYDDRQAGYQAGLHLIEQGARNAWFLSPFTVDWAQARCDGAKEAFSVTGTGADKLIAGMAPIAMDEALEEQKIVGDLRVHEDLAYRQARALLAGNSFPDAVIGANDWIAFGFMRAAAELGFQAGRDYLIIGFDDHPRSRQYGLSSMRPPLEAAGRLAGGMLMDTVAGRDGIGSGLKLPFQLARRSSTQSG